jgi:hypothetical protein
VDIPTVEHDLDRAEEAVAEARAVRHALRWKVEKSDPGRKAQIEDELDNVAEAMAPIRSYIGRLMFEPLPDALEARLRDVSKQLQHQRRALKRMR